ncbi:MAG: hypothetical protein U1E47_05350 [Rivihabitans pingtungensis]
MSVCPKMRWAALCLLITTSSAWAASPDVRAERLEQRSQQQEQRADTLRARADRIDVADAKHPKVAERHERRLERRADTLQSR